MRTILITGGANGIGKELVKTYADLGNTVIFTDIDKKGAQFFDTFENVHFEFLDSSKLEDVESFMKKVASKYSVPDVLINNVGVSVKKPLLSMSTDEFIKVQNINYISGYILSRELVRLREEFGIKNDYGRIVFMSSTRHLMSEESSEAYASSKGAIVSLTHALAASTADTALTVNAISPGWIENGDYSLLTQEDHEQHFSRRVGKASDIAKACLYLTDENNDFVNGQNLYIDGGMTKKMIYVE